MIIHDITRLTVLLYKKEHAWHALFKIKKGRGKMKNKKNALGISALVIFFIFILLQGYSVAYFIVNSHNVYKYVSKEVTFSYIMLGIIQILYMVVLITWFVFFIYERKISRIPLIITFGYFVFRIIDNLIIHKITMGYYAKKGFLKEVYKDSWLKDNWNVYILCYD